MTVIVIEKDSEAFNHLAKAFDNTHLLVHKVSLGFLRDDFIKIKHNEGMWSHALKCSVPDRLTTRTYAVGVEAVNIGLAGSIIDLHGSLDSIVYNDENPEYHVTCTGPAALHSAMLEHFEWTGE